MEPSKDKLPLHEDIMQLARLGEIGPVQKLFKEGKYTAKYKDGEGITPLHVYSALVGNAMFFFADTAVVGCDQ